MAKKVETYSSSSVQEFKWSGGYQENDPNSARVTGANCEKVEFYDEDKNRAGYEDNEWKHGEGCLEFPWDLRGDLGGAPNLLKVKAGMIAEQGAGKLHPFAISSHMMSQCFGKNSRFQKRG